MLISRTVTIAVLCLAQPVLAQDMSYGPTVLTSINSGNLSVYGEFNPNDDLPTLEDAEKTTISVNGVGASIAVTQLAESGHDHYHGRWWWWHRRDGIGCIDCDLATTSFESMDATAENTGDISVTGVFNGTTMSGESNRNAMSVMAVGASITFSSDSTD